MRRALAAGAVCALAVLGVTGAASGHHAPARSCSEIVHYNANPQAVPPWAEAEWSQNSCGWYERGFVHCRNGRSLIFAEGGWVRSTGLYSRATCPGGYNFLQGFGNDSKTCSSCAYTRHWDFGNRAAARPARAQLGQS